MDEPTSNTSRSSLGPLPSIGAAPPQAAPSSLAGPLPPINSGAAPSSTSLLGPLPPIDAVQPPVPPPPQARSAEEQAAIEAEIDELHEALGVKRGHALSEAMKPPLTVPMPPVQMAVPEPREPPAPTATTVAAEPPPTAATATVAPAPPAQPAAAPAPEHLLALPAPEDVNSLITLDVSTGQAVTLDHMGPVVVNTDGTLSRITNWARLTDEEQNATKRRIAKRNVERLKAFRDRGELKDSLLSALQGTTVAEQQDPAPIE